MAVDGSLAILPNGELSVDHLIPHGGLGSPRVAKQPSLGAMWCRVYEHTLRPPLGTAVKVTGWIAEYDPTTCDFVIATGRNVGPATLGMTNDASRPDMARALEGQSPAVSDGFAYPAAGFRVVTPFMRAAFAVTARL